MAEYYQEYLDYKKRLLTLQIKINSNTNLSDNTRTLKLSYIDSLLKNLDERYMENRNLSMIDALILEIEKDE